MLLHDLQMRYTTRWNEWRVLNSALNETRAAHARVADQLRGLAWVAVRYYAEGLREATLQVGVPVPDDIANALRYSHTAGAVADNPNAPLTFAKLRADYNRVHEQRAQQQAAEEEAQAAVDQAAADLEGLRSLARGFHEVDLQDPEAP